MSVSRFLRIHVEENASRLPVKAFILYFVVNELRNSSVNPVIYSEALSIIRKYREVLSLSILKDHPLIKSYRNYLWRIGFDPTKIRPSHEALIRRALRTGVFPRINTVVDIGNLVSMEYMVPVGLYDIAKISGELIVRLSIDGEVFYPIGRDIAQVLPPGLPVIADEERVVHVFPYRDSKFTSVGLKTRHLLVVIDGVEGVPLSQVYKAADKIKDYLRKYADTDKIGEYNLVEFGGYSHG
ncbi:MAG: hypothetical protein J7K21_01660 [Desulfurococcales archaeon]|nr:hypothetical protein [Desulfurococcales archaeon]